MSILVLIAFYLALFAAPRNFPSNGIIGIERGSSASAIADQLSNEHIVSHALILELLLRLSGGSGGVHAGSYRFENPQNVFFVAYRLLAGDYGFPAVRITFPEGITVRESAAKIEEAFPGIKAVDFQNAARQYEGYLFPDTYLFVPSEDAASIISLMRVNFDTKIGPLSDDIRASGRTLSDTIILASLIEKEARTDESRRMVAGILLNRLKLGMPLQVDAVFGYIFNRDTYNPSFKDLTVDSPYNTYTYKGLPPGPICNPGLSSIEAVLHPTKTKYLYYLTGKDNLMHYATTYAEHQANQKKYLR
ncbi:MAG: endolytic transglycosylase MltG [bacterium]|nr:endolytic transglycosylase MltG [bacterium]